MPGIPGSGGPPPKRSDQRRRRNKPDVEVTTAPAGPVVSGVPSADVSWHPLAREWFDSLAHSGQARFYEPSDWAEARICGELMSKLLSADKPSAQLAQTVLAWTTTLMTTEGSRRRLRLELARGTAVDPDEEASVAALDDYRRMVGG